MEKILNGAVGAIAAWKPAVTPGCEQPKLLMTHPLGSEGLTPPHGLEAQVVAPLVIPKLSGAPSSSLEVGQDDISEHISHNNAPRRLAFHKPPSSNGDPAAGYQFPKAVRPQLNMSRQKLAPPSKLEGAKPSTTDHQPETLPSVKECTEAVQQPLSPAQVLAANPIQEDTQVDVRQNQWLPTVKAGETLLSGTSPPKDKAAPLEHSAPTHEDTTMGDITSTHNEADPPKSTEATSLAGASHIGANPRIQTLNRPMRPPTPSTPTQPRNAHRTKSKVTKPRGRAPSRAPNAPRINLNDLVSKSNVTQEDLLHVLIARYSKEKLEREQIRANHATEIHELETLSRSLWERLQDSQLKAKSQETEITGLRAQQPKFADQIKKLRDYVKGLTNDQHGLRSSFNEIHQMYSAKQESKKQLDIRLEDVRQTASDIDKRTANALKEAKHEMENLMRINQNQKAQLQKDDELLQYERTRSQQMEVEIAKINTSQQQSMHIFAEHANQIVQKMNSLLDQTRNNSPAQQPESLDEVKTALRQCLDSLDELRQMKSVKVEDVSQMGDSIRECVDSISKTMQAYHDDVKTSEKNHQGTILEVQEQVRNLSTSVSTERDSSKQISDLETRNAENQAKLDLAEAALEKERQKVTAIGEKESALSSQISSLESEAAALRAKSQESTAAAIRLTEIAAHTSAIQGSLRSMKDATSDALLELQGKFQEHANVQLQKESIESELKEERAKAISVATERLKLEREASSKLVEVQLDHSRTAKWEMNILMAEHRLEIQKLEDQLAVVKQKNDKLAKSNHEWGATLMEQVRLTAEMRTAKDEAEQRAKECLNGLETVTKERLDAKNLASDRLNELNGLKATMIAEDTRTQELQKTVDQLSKQLEESTTQVNSTRSSIRLAIEDVDECKKTITEKNAQISERDAQLRGLDHSIGERVSELQQANENLESAKQQHEMKIHNLNESHKAAEALHKATILGLQEEIKALQKSSVASPSKSIVRDKNVTPPQRRIAERNAIGEKQQIVEDSQSQQRLDSVDLHSPSTSAEMLDDEMQYIDPSLFDMPLTPIGSSQTAKPTVSFAEDQTRSGYFGSQQQSPSRTRRPAYQGRVVEDSQDQMTSMQPAKKFLFETPTYGTMRAHNERVTTSQSTSHQISQSSAMPRGILKTGNGASNGGLKRSNAAAGLVGSTAEPKKTRRTSTSGPGLGPILPDSQSPHGSTRRAKRTSRAIPSNAPKVDKFTRRFSQELQ